MSMGEIATRTCPTHGKYTYDMFNGSKEDTVCPKCKEVKKSMNYELQNSYHMLQEGTIGEPTALQKAVDQIGIDAVMKSLGPSVALGFCDMHGHYTMPQRTMDTPEGKAPPISCPSCPPNPANGTSATDVELYIDIDPSQNLGTNPQQKVPTYEQDVRGKTKVVMPTISPNS